MSQGRLTKEDLDPRLIEEIDNTSTRVEEVDQRNTQHFNDLDNPHGVTAEQLALGNVQNFGVATQVEAEEGMAADKYMTSQRTKQAIDKNLENISQSVTDLEEQVSLHLDETNYETTARTIYVSALSGNDDAGDGNVSNPFKTITKAVSTVNKNIANIITIKVLPGDYRAEGNILLKNYRGTYLMITAFDGTNDVLSPNDNYLVERITMYDSEAIYIQGLKFHPSEGFYGIYMSNCRFVKISGYKNESNGGSGLGCTGNSFVWIENATARNLSTVISANHGATVVSQNWLNSTGNNNGIVVDVGSKVHLYDDNQPTATVKYTQRNSGVIFNKNGVFIGGDKIPVTSFLNNWNNMNAGYEPLVFWKDGEGNVHIQGVVTGGSVGSAIFNLPADFRPKLAIDGIGTSGNAGVFAAVRIYASGDIQHLSGGVEQLSINLMFKP